MNKVPSINELYTGVEQNMMEMEPKIKALEKKYYETQKKLNDTEAELKAMKDQYESLRLCKESLELVDLKQNEAPKEKVNKILGPKKDPVLVKFDRYNNELGKWRTQKAAAREMGWDQSSVSKFMKFTKEQQISKKGFYFQWERYR